MEILVHDRSTYNNHKCRCTICKKANAEGQRIYLQKHRIPSDVVCKFGGCECMSMKFSTGYCRSHYQMINSLIKNGVRTKEEIELTTK